MIHFFHSETLTEDELLSVATTWERLAGTASRTIDRDTVGFHCLQLEPIEAVEFGSWFSLMTELAEQARQLRESTSLLEPWLQLGTKCKALKIHFKISSSFRIVLDHDSVTLEVPDEWDVAIDVSRNQELFQRAIDLLDGTSHVSIQREDDERLNISSEEPWIFQDAKISLGKSSKRRICFEGFEAITTSFAAASELITEFNADIAESIGIRLVSYGRHSDYDEFRKLVRVETAGWLVSSLISIRESYTHWMAGNGRRPQGIVPLGRGNLDGDDYVVCIVEKDGHPLIQLSSESLDQDALASLAKDIIRPGVAITERRFGHDPRFCLDYSHSNVLIKADPVNVVAVLQEKWRPQSVHTDILTTPVQEAIELTEQLFIFRLNGYAWTQLEGHWLKLVEDLDEISRRLGTIVYCQEFQRSGGFYSYRLWQDGELVESYCSFSESLIEDESLKRDGGQFSEDGCQHFWSKRSPAQIDFARDSPEHDMLTAEEAYLAIANFHGGNGAVFECDERCVDSIETAYLLRM